MRRDFEEYLVQVQKQYTELQNTIDKVNKQLADGLITQEAAEPIREYYDKISANYDRLLYCRFLYNLPPKFIQKLQNKKLEKVAKKYMTNHSDKDAIVSENKECLDAIKEYVVEESKE